MIIYAELSYHIEALRSGLLLRTSFYKSGGLLIETIQMIILVCSWLRRAGNASQGVSIYCCNDNYDGNFGDNDDKK